MSKSINITVSSGTVAIGAVVQGDGSKLDVSQTQSSTINNEVENLLRRLKSLADSEAIPSSNLELVNAKVREIAEAAKSDDRGKGVGVLKLLKDNFSWAYPAVKDFAVAVWPAIVAAVGA